MNQPKIEIKPSNRGALHRELGVPQGQKIPQSKLESAESKAKKTGNTKLEKRVNFAENFGKKTSDADDKPTGRDAIIARLKERAK